MSEGTRFDVRPPQRGKDGFARLAREPAPSVSDVMIDSFRIRLSGRMRAADATGSNVEVFERHKVRLIDASGISAAVWKCPPVGSTRTFSVELAAGHSTVNARQKVDLDQEGATIALDLQANPTRTLRHLLARAPEGEPFRDWLDGLSAEEFFAKSAELQPLQTADDNDNALVNLNQPRHLMGKAFIGSLLDVFEDKLSDWAVSAAAIHDLAIRERRPSGLVRLVSSTDELTFDWSKISPRSIETYIERRHSSANALLERLKDDVQSSQYAASWRRYGINEIGERFGNTVVIGTDLTRSIQRKVYAKTMDRVRIETRYTKGVMNSLRLKHRELGPHPLATICNAARMDTINRLQWDVICDLCVEPRRATLAEAIDMISSIGREARAHRRPAGPVTFALISTGGVEATDPDGAIPLSLLEALEARGIVSRENLQRRRRPGRPHKFHLTEAWMEVARRMREAFSEE